MQVILEKEYPVSAPVEAAWEVLSRVELLATCMPGASISEKIDERHFKGQVKVKVGPASANFGGDITLKSLDASQRQIQMMGKGADKGGSSASMDLTASVVAVDQATSKLVGRAEVTVTGKFAQFGGRMMNSVSDMILAQFAQNFSNRAQLQSLAAKPQPSTPPPGHAGGAAPGGQADGRTAPAAALPPASTGVPSGSHGQTSGTTLPHGPESNASAAHAPEAGASPSGQAAASELNALGLLWGLIRRFFAGLFGRK